MATTTSENLVARMDRLPFSKFHKKIFGLAAAGYLFDAYDMALLSFIMPVLAKDLNLTGVQIGLVFSATFLGMFFGAVLGGAVADRFGRLRIFQYTLLIFSVATALTGFAWDFYSLLVLRFITGLGLGGEQPVVFTFVSEMVPNKYRGRINGLTEATWGLGMLLAAATSLLVLPYAGWRWTFVAGIIPAFLIWFFRLGIPESPRWFLIKGNAEKAEQELVKIEKEVEAELGKALPKPDPISTVAQNKEVKLSALFRRGFAKRTWMLWLLWFFTMFGYWGVNSWLPTLLKQAGYSLYASIGLVFIMNTVWVPSGILGAYLSDKVGRKKPLITYLVLAGITTLIYGWALANSLPVGVMLTCGILAIVFMAGAFAVQYAYTPENYPTEVRGSGTGAANAMGRLGAILAPTIMGYLMPLVGLYPTLGVVASAFVAGGLVLALFGVETKGRSLEAISNETMYSQTT